MTREFARTDEAITIELNALEIKISRITDAKYMKQLG